MLMELPMARKQAQIKVGGDSYLHASAAKSSQFRDLLI
jgi:hypothetical protein